MSHSLCENKTQYPTAEAAVERLRHRQGRVRERLYAYKCQQCLGFHLTKLRPPAELIVTLKSYTYRKDRP